MVYRDRTGGTAVESEVELFFLQYVQVIDKRGRSSNGGGCLFVWYDLVVKGHGSGKMQMHTEIVRLGGGGH